MYMYICVYVYVYVYMYAHVYRTTAYKGDQVVEAANGAMIAVQVRYRVNFGGFLALRGLSLEGGHGSPYQSSGNYGLYDQVLAMKWIQANAASFGGDPNRVTIYGESGMLSQPASMPIPYQLNCSSHANFLLTSRILQRKLLRLEVLDLC
jgi:carboxylesterase type B